ncbi:unnamed protein product [Callosobruchus maculatus]|nr:unnamed protein product [Callosobruchus maculatus]
MYYILIVSIIIFQIHFARLTINIVLLKNKFY